VQVVPGINLLGLTILLGKRVAGLTGIALALIGLLLPSASLTVLLTAGYARISALPAVQAAFRGIVPAIVGLGLLTAAQMARPLFATARGEGRISLLFYAALFAGSGAAVVLLRSPVVLVLLMAGGAGALFSWYRAPSGRAAREMRP
jgi:chromate transporter